MFVILLFQRDLQLLLANRNTNTHKTWTEQSEVLMPSRSCQIKVAPVKVRNWETTTYAKVTSPGWEDNLGEAHITFNQYFSYNGIGLKIQ